MSVPTDETVLGQRRERESLERERSEEMEWTWFLLITLTSGTYRPVVDVVANKRIVWTPHFRPQTWGRFGVV